MSTVRPTIVTDVAELRPWVDQMIASWGYSTRDETWFRERIADVPLEATCAGGFVANAIELVPDMPGRAEMQRELRILEINRFGRHPLNHFLLTLVHAANRLGQSGVLAHDMETVQKAISRGIGAALIRATLPGFEGMHRIGEILRHIARAMTGTLFSHLTVSVSRRDTSFVVRHVGEHNFLAHFHYATAYYHVCGAEFGPATGADFEWSAVDEATITIHAR